jgi:L-ascorbate metabolism protein UlaG (beta-lactamase superfamily)
VVTYIANEGFLVEGGGKRVLIDALFDDGFGTYLAPTPELLDKLAEAREPFADIDLILITHPHGDHFNPKVVAAHLRKNQRCRLIAHAQTVDQLRKEEGFAQIRDQIREVRLEPGSEEKMTINGIALDVLCLAHSPYYRDGRNVHEQTRNLAFAVNLGGTRFLHLGDATLQNSAAHLRAYPFDRARVDLLFLNSSDTSQAAQQMVTQEIKPEWIVAMHVAPAEFAADSKSVRAAYPNAILFGKSMEQHAFRAAPPSGAANQAYAGPQPPTE